MLDVNEGTPDIQQKRYCEAVIKLLSELDGNSASVGTIHLSLVLADEETDSFSFSVKPTKYGPRIKNFEKIINVLVEHDLVKRVIEDGTKHIELTKKPYTEFHELSKEERKVLEWVASTHANSSGKIISFMNLQYPEYFSDE